MTDAQVAMKQYATLNTTETLQAQVELLQRQIELMRETTQKLRQRLDNSDQERRRLLAMLTHQP